MPQNDFAEYEKWKKEQERLWESRCTRCGACCGTREGDPCEALREGGDGVYYCSIYPDRFGMRRSRSGRVFCCVPIRDILNDSWPGSENCSYKTGADTSA